MSKCPHDKYCASPRKGAWLCSAADTYDHFGCYEGERYRNPWHMDVGMPSTLTRLTSADLLPSLQPIAAAAEAGLRPHLVDAAAFRAVWLHGGVGFGKTWIAAVLANNIVGMQGRDLVTVRWVNPVVLGRQLASVPKWEQHKVLDPLRTCSLLVFDDAYAISSDASAVLDALIYERCDAAAPLIVVAYEDVTKTYADPTKVRIYSRMLAATDGLVFDVEAATKQVAQ